MQKWSLGRGQDRGGGKGLCSQGGWGKVDFGKLCLEGGGVGMSRFCYGAENGKG